MILRFNSTSRPVLGRRAALAALIPLAFAPLAARADRIERTSGSVVEGIVVARGERSVTVKVGGATMEIPADKVKRIIEDSPADNKLLGVRGTIAAKPAEGIGALGECAREGASPDRVAAILLSYSEEIAAAVPTLGTEARDALAAALGAAAPVRLPRQGDFLLCQLRLRLALDDIAGVRALMETIKREEPRALERDGERIANWFLKKIDAALDAGKFSEALDLLIELRAVNQDQAGMKRAEMALLWARGERERGEWGKAIQIYATQLMDVSPAIARERIAVTLEEAEMACREAGEMGRAIDLYEEYGMQHAPERAKTRLVGLWRDLGWQLLRKGETARAREFFERLEQADPGAAGDDLRHCEFRESRAKLGPEDYVGHYKLGEWCLDAGLLSEAKEEFAAASGSEILRPNISDQARRLNNLTAEKELTRLVDLYDQGKYIDALAGVEEMKRGALGEGFRRQADELEALAKKAIEISAAERPQQAEALWQRAERAYYLGQLSESYDLLKGVMERYPDTPAGGRALAFYRKIRPRLDLSAMEQTRHRRHEFPAIEESGVGGDSVSEGATRREPEDPEAAAIAAEIKRLRDGMKLREDNQP